jgi:glycerophosphoryl diester phosphodiesterase
VIEIDVVSARGELVAGRDLPLHRVAQRVFRGLTLADAWKNASPADAVKLDLQQDDRQFLDEVVGFVGSRATQRRVMISSRSRDALLYLHARLPQVTLLFSIGFPDAVESLMTDTHLQRAIGGVSVFQGLVDPGLVAWAHTRHLLVVAWTVNDVGRLNELVGLGVDGITTADLAILQVLSASG